MFLYPALESLARMQIPDDLYRRIIDAIPILCVDIVLKDGDRFLLVKREREPLKGRWWVPGGRVLKGETIITAARRKIREELGARAEILEPLGYYEKLFKKNEFGVESGIHTLSIVVSARPLTSKIRLDYQSSAWKYSRTLPKYFKIKPFYPGVSL